MFLSFSILVSLFFRPSSPTLLIPIEVCQVEETVDMSRINLQGSQQQGLNVSLVLCHRGQVVQGDHVPGPQPGTKGKSSCPIEVSQTEKNKLKKNIMC